MYVYSFEKLVVWREAMDFTRKIYKLTSFLPDSEKYGLVSQLRRASLSICSNLAEGTSRKTGTDKAYFTTVAFSSTMEILNQLIIAKELQYLDAESYEGFRRNIDTLANKLNALRKSQLRK